jgi:hypothetical protein
MCSQFRIRNTRLVASLSTSCNNAVILSSCYKVVTHNLLGVVELQDDNMQVVGTTCDKSVEVNNLVASGQQAADNLLTSSANISILLTSCYNLLVFMCVLLYDKENLFLKPWDVHCNAMLLNVKLCDNTRNYNYVYNTQYDLMIFYLCLL